MIEPLNPTTSSFTHVERFLIAFCLGYHQKYMDGVLQTIPTQKVAAAQAKGSISSSFADTIQAFTVSGSSTYLPD